MLIATDEPRPFRLTSAASVADAVGLWHEKPGTAMYLAGGGDAIDMLKKHHATPSLVIDLKRIPGLSGITVSDGSITIGGLTTLHEIANDERLKQRLPALCKAASIVATPQIRNVATIGGNLLQENRCSYFRGPWHCYRHGGLHCYAHHGHNKEHAIFDGDRCYAVSPSDLAPVITATEARINVQGREGPRVLGAQELFVTASQDLTRMHSLKRGEVLTAVEFSAPPGVDWSGSNTESTHRYRSVFIKNAVRQSFDFSLVNVAVCAVFNQRQVTWAKVVLGAVAATPHRCLSAERLLVGKDLDKTLVQQVASAAVEGAQPLQQNGYKVALARELVADALMELL